MSERPTPEQLWGEEIAADMRGKMSQKDMDDFVEQEIDARAERQRTQDLVEGNAVLDGESIRKARESLRQLDRLLTDRHRPSESIERIYSILVAVERGEKISEQDAARVLNEVSRLNETFEIIRSLALNLPEKVEIVSEMK